MMVWWKGRKRIWCGEVCMYVKFVSTQHLSIAEKGTCIKLQISVNLMQWSEKRCSRPKDMSHISIAQLFFCLSVNWWRWCTVFMKKVMCGYVIQKEKKILSQ